MKQNFQKWIENIEEHFKAYSLGDCYENEKLFKESLKNTLEFKKHFNIDPLKEFNTI